MIALDENHQPGPVALAAIAFSALVTGCSGTLIALLAFAAQVQLSPAATLPFFWAVGLIGAALAATIWSALAGYLSELAMANGRDNNTLWWVAFVLAFAAASMFTVGLLASAISLYRQIA